MGVAVLRFGDDPPLQPFDRLGDGADVYLASAELAAVAAVLGKLPTPEEYLVYANDLDTMADDIYRYLNFHEIESFQQSAASATIPAVNIVEVA